MFEGFRREFIQANGVEIHAVVGGEGPPLLLLHGYPQSHVMWHKIAPALAEKFTVVASDLRGYGDSGKPPGGERHEAYSKRAMARDQVEVMAALGFERFRVVGHDRGARVVDGKLNVSFPEEPSLRYASIMGLVARCREAEHAINSFRWLVDKAPAEWIQLFATDLFPQLRERDQLAPVHQALTSEPKLAEFLSEFTSLLTS